MKRFLTGINTVIFTFILITLTIPSVFAQSASRLEIDYQAHVSKQGWQDPVHDGQTAGTTGQGLSLEALKIALPQGSALGDNSGVTYSLQCQNIGWTPEVSNGQEAGTTGRGLRAEAASIKLTGKAAELYDIFYRVHSSNYGWLDWAKNGQVAGTQHLATPAEALQIEVLPKGSAAPGPTDMPEVNPTILAAKADVEYTPHVQNIGWQGTFKNGEMAGTNGQALQIEAFTINMPNLSPGSSIVYQAHVAYDGWQQPVSNGNIAGTVGEGKSVQAFNIALTGIDSYSYDIYYQAYVQNYGWLGWAKNGQRAGTTGGGLRVEAMKVLLLPRGSQAPGSTENAFLELHTLENQTWLWPLDNIVNISSGFGWREGRVHQGIDCLAPYGTPIKAAKAGTVTLATYYGGYGNCVIITNDSTGEDVYYAHMSTIGTVPGKHVQRGEVIGFVGMTGSATANHLHLGVCDHGVWTDPLEYY